MKKPNHDYAGHMVDLRSEGAEQYAVYAFRFSFEA
jgi:hypothetical protein